MELEGLSHRMHDDVLEVFEMLTGDFGPTEMAIDRPIGGCEIANDELQ